MSQAVKTTLVLSVKPEAADTAGPGFEAMAADTRGFQGCRRVEVYRSIKDPTRFMLLGEWESREDYDRYLAWRAENRKAGGQGGDIMASPPVVDYWSLITG
jgi:quinol monooxygenase YgiN